MLNFCKNYTFIFVLVCILSFYNCHFNKNITNNNNAKEYSQLGIQHKVQLFVWEQENNEKVVFVKNLPDNFSLTYNLYTQLEEEKSIHFSKEILTFKDTLGVKMISLSNSMEGDKIEFKLIDAQPYWLAEPQFSKVLIYDIPSKEILFDNHIKSEEEFLFVPSELNLLASFTPLNKRNYMPALPFDESETKKYVSKPRPIELNQSIQFKEQGTYLLTWKNKEGKMVEDRKLRLVSQDFPFIENTSSRIEPIQYICSSGTFNKIAENQNVDQAIETFWLEKAGSYERANVLIEEFYGRVERSNVLFTNDKMGWKTDRGLIFIVFGAPDKVIRLDGKEQWYYQFNFPLASKREEWFTFLINKKGEYNLVRLMDYKEIWEAQQNLWQNGILN